MAEITYSGRGSHGNIPAAPQSKPQQQPHAEHQQPQIRSQRPSTAAPRLEGNSRAARLEPFPGPGGIANAQPTSAHRMLAFLDSAERAAAKQLHPPTFPIPASSSQGQRGGGGGGAGAHTRPRPLSVAPLRPSGSPRIVAHFGDAEPKTPRKHGRAALFHRETEERAAHEVPGATLPAGPLWGLKNGRVIDLNQKHKRQTISSHVLLLVGW